MATATRRVRGGPAVTELQGIARFKFHEGKLEEFKRLSARAMEIARTQDTGTLRYEIYFMLDQSDGLLLERYTSYEALIEHGAPLGELADSILATVPWPSACLALPSAELRALLAGSPVQLFTPYLSL